MTFPSGHVVVRSFPPWPSALPIVKDAGELGLPAFLADPVLKLAQYCCDRAAVLETAMAKRTSRDAGDHREAGLLDFAILIVVEGLSQYRPATCEDI